MARIYLAVPIVAGRDLAVARSIAEALVGLGHEVVSTWVLKEDADVSLSPERIFERDVKGVRECDVLVAEVSTPSHGVGIEIMLAQTLKKPVFCLHRPRISISRMLRGMPGIVLLEYQSLPAVKEPLKALDARCSRAQAGLP